jgi:hypothetical protein
MKIASQRLNERGSRYSDQDLDAAKPGIDEKRRKSRKAAFPTRSLALAGAVEEDLSEPTYDLIYERVRVREDPARRRSYKRRGHCRSITWPQC